MNQQIWTKSLQPELRPAPVAEERALSPGDILWFLRRYRLRLCLLGLAGGLAGLAYAAVTPSVYTARAQIVIDPNMPALFADKNGEGRSPLDTGQIANQIAILKSEKIALMVIERFKLFDDAEFRRKGGMGGISGAMSGMLPGPQERGADSPRAGILDAIVALVARPVVPAQDAVQGTAKGAAPLSAQAASVAADTTRRTVLDDFGARLDVRRAGLAYALDVSFSSLDPEKAAAIANAVVDAFMQEKADARIEAVREGAQWLSDRIDQVRREMNAATHAVQVFRASHDYRIPRPKVETGAGAPQPASGQGDLSPAAGRASGPTIEELESSAETLRKIYESLLGVLAESAQKQSAPVLDSRVITSATRPIYRSSPRMRIIVPAAALGSVALGLGLGLAGLLLDGRVRTRRQVRAATGLDCLARVARDGSPYPAPRFRQRSLDRALRGLGLGRRGGARQIDLAMTRPALTEGLRWVRHAALAAGQPGAVQTLGLAVADRSVGALKSAAVMHLARLHAAGGSRTLVVDTDISDLAITRAFAPGATHGLFDVLNGGPGYFERAIVHLGKDCDLLPLAGSRAEFGRDLLASPMMDVALKSLLSGYDLVIVDLPPVSEVAEALAVARLVQGVVLVARWGQTPVSALSEGAAALEAGRARILGTVLVDIDPTAIETAG